MKYNKFVAMIAIVATMVLPLTALAAAGGNGNGGGNGSNANNGNNGTTTGTTASTTVTPGTGAADNGKKITICHATSSETNPYNTLHVSENATAGHFEENGTQAAGHELDLLIDSPNAVCPTTGSITVIKKVVGGTATSSDFNLHLKRGSTEATNSPFAGNSTGTSFSGITAGFFYDVSEDAATDYTASFSGDCNASGHITLRGGESRTCTVTNTFTGIAAPDSIDLVVDKSVDVSNPLEGDTVVYTITVTNNGPDAATNVVLDDNLPSGVTYVSDSTATGSYDKASGDWTIGNLANGVTATLTLTATVDSGTVGDTITNTATADATETDSDTSNNTDDADLTVRAPGVPSIDLAVDKTVADDTLTAGSTASYTITVTNNGPDSASNVVLTDILPTDLTFSSSVVSQGTFDSTAGTWSFASLASGSSATLTLVATVNNGTAVSTVITNSASVDADESDSNPANNTDSVDLTVIAGPGNPAIDLVVDKSVSPANPLAGDTVTYTITVTNNGVDAATNVVVADVLPAGVTYVSQSPIGSYNTTTHNWTVGNLAVGGSATLTLAATVDAGVAAGTTITNSATATATENDVNPANNTDTADVVVRAVGAPSIDIAVNKSVNDSTLTANSTGTYTITVTNNGPDDATGVVLTDILPGNVTYESSTTSTGSYNSGTGAWTIGSLASGASATLTLSASINAGTATGTVITNTATATAVESDSNPANNTDTADITVIKRGGGGSSGSSSNNNNNGRVLGDTTSIPYIAPPAGQVLGDSTTIPSNAPSGRVLGDSTSLPVTGSSLNYLWGLLGVLAMLAIPVKIMSKMKEEFASSDLN